MEPTSFVTGAGGCVGRRLVGQLLAEGWQVRALLMEHEKDAYSDVEGVEAVVGTLADVSGEMIPAGSVVFHLAAQVHSVPKTEAQREAFFTVNRDGTARLAEAAVEAAAGGFVFLSTIAVYGDRLAEGIVDEQTPPAPNSPYGQSKLEAEGKLREILAGVVPYVILRPCVIYGPGDRGNFARLIESVQAGKFPVVRGGRARKNTLYVGNLAKILVRLAEKIDSCDGEVYNVADPEPRSMRQIALDVAEVAGVDVQIRDLPYWLLKPAACCGDLAGALLGRELPLSSRKLRVLTTDSLVCTDKLYSTIDTESLLAFRQGLSEYLADRHGAGNEG